MSYVGSVPAAGLPPHAPRRRPATAPHSTAPTSTEASPTPEDHRSSTAAPPAAPSSDASHVTDTTLPTSEVSVTPVASVASAAPPPVSHSSMSYVGSVPAATELRIDAKLVRA